MFLHIYDVLSFSMLRTDLKNLKTETKSAAMHNNVINIVNNIASQTSKWRLSYQVKFLPIGFKYETSSCRKTYSVHQTAVSMGFIGKSVKILDIFLTFFLNSVSYKARVNALCSCCSVISEISSGIETPISSSRIALKSWSTKSGRKLKWQFIKYKKLIPFTEHNVSAAYRSQANYLTSVCGATVCLYSSWGPIFFAFFMVAYHHETEG